MNQENEHNNNTNHPDSPEDYPVTPIEISRKDILISVAGGLIAGGLALVYLGSRYGHNGFDKVITAVSTTPAGAMATYIMSKVGEAIKDSFDHLQ